MIETLKDAQWPIKLEQSIRNLKNFSFLGQKWEKRLKNNNDFLTLTNKNTLAEWR